MKNYNETKFQDAMDTVQKEVCYTVLYVGRGGGCSNLVTGPHSQTQDQTITWTSSLLRVWVGFRLALRLFLLAILIQ